jgi:PAS domain S-box-containing protein
MRSSSLDWSHLAVHALELVTRPAWILDEQRIVCAWNRAIAALTGRSAEDVVGRPWATVRGETDERRVDGLELALGQGKTEATTTIVTTAARRLAVELAVRRPGDALTLVTIVAHRPADASDANGDGELVYRIDGTPDRRFRLQSIEGDARRVPDQAEGGLCFEVLQRRTTPCPSCPATAIQPGEARSAVLTSGEGQEPIRLVTARAGEGYTRVSSAEIADETLWALVETKVKLLARRADLSVREQDVLLWLLRGRTPQDVATLLGIAPRTVKFHQANVLRKLGAESRIDLLRLIF